MYNSCSMKFALVFSSLSSYRKNGAGYDVGSAT